MPTTSILALTLTLTTDPGPNPQPPLTPTLPPTHTPTTGGGSNSGYKPNSRAPTYGDMISYARPYVKSRRPEARVKG